MRIRKVNEMMDVHPEERNRQIDIEVENLGREYLDIIRRMRDSIEEKYGEEGLEHLNHKLNMLNKRMFEF